MNVMIDSICLSEFEFSRIGFDSNSLIVVIVLINLSLFIMNGKKSVMIRKFVSCPHTYYFVMEKNEDSVYVAGLIFGQLREDHYAYPFIYEKTDHLGKWIVIRVDTPTGYSPYKAYRKALASLAPFLTVEEMVGYNITIVRCYLYTPEY